MPGYPGMIIVRQIFLLCDWDRHKDRLSHCVAFECDIDGEQFRDRLDYRFVNGIRDAVPDRINNYDGIYSRPRKPVPPEIVSGNKTCRHTEQQ